MLSRVFRRLIRTVMRVSTGASAQGKACPRCGYNLAGQRERGCPECGWKRRRSLILVQGLVRESERRAEAAAGEGLSGDLSGRPRCRL
jgi:hypothetical protein